MACCHGDGTKLRYDKGLPIDPRHSWSFVVAQSAIALADREPVAPAGLATATRTCDDLLELFGPVSDGRSAPPPRTPAPGQLALICAVRALRWLVAHGRTWPGAQGLTGGEKSVTADYGIFCRRPAWEGSKCASWPGQHGQPALVSRSRGPPPHIIPSRIDVVGCRTGGLAFRQLCGVIATRRASCS